MTALAEQFATQADAAAFIATEREKRARAKGMRSETKWPGINKYCPHRPWPKQEFMLNLDCREIFFGGAKGPGKTDLLLMAVLRYVDVPGYAALILRRDTKRASQAHSIMDRFEQWTAGTDAHWNRSNKVVRFPSGAMVKFGYIDTPSDRYQYMSSEYQTIVWDELTEFALSEDESNSYRFMMGMNRGPVSGPVSTVPWQILSASNPGGVSHDWVKNRFVTQEALDEIADPTPRAFYIDDTKTRCFVPAKITDNPAIDAEKYIRESLSHLPPITRERYVNGDWSIQEFAIISPEWLHRYEMKGEHLIALNAEGTAIYQIDCRECRRFATIDTAGTSKEKAADAKGKPPSWSVCAVWDYDARSKYLFLRDVWRDRVGWDGLKSGIRDTLERNNCPLALIEDAHHGRPLAAELKTTCPFDFVGPRLKGMISTSGDGAKLERAINSGMLSKLEAGQVFLPRFNTSWLAKYEAELFSWTGLPDGTADQIDVTSYAVHHIADAPSDRFVAYRDKRTGLITW